MLNYFSFIFSDISPTLFISYTINSSIGHIPVLPIQNSIIITIFTAAGAAIPTYAGPSPVFPSDDADIVYASSKFCVYISIMVAPSMNIMMYAITYIRTDLMSLFVMSIYFLS